MVRDQTSYGFAFRRGRAQVEVPIDFETYGDAFLATSINIGLGGLFVASERRFAIGDRFDLRFTLPDQPLPIAVGAEVRWLHQDQGRVLGMGLRFVRLPIPAATAIQEFLRRSDEDLTPSGPST
jgi:uncharacterized protein (TIGR02266 family)